MNAEEAEAILTSVLEPLRLDTFFAALGRQVVDAPGRPGHPRAALFGDDPVATALSAHSTHSERLDCHGVNPALPPPGARKVADETEFRSLINAYHERDYTVRIPEVVSLSPGLQRFVRALEALLHQPVDASLFWSKAGAGAVVHYDNRDNLVFQLHGRKRWYISADRAGLQNNWRQVGEPPLSLREHRVYDLGPGDLLYIPRGTAHTVESASESLHLAILFVPTTLREVLIAAVDHMSDLDRSWRETALERVDDGPFGLPSRVVRQLERLVEQCRSYDFVEAAIQHRSSRFVGSLPALPRSAEAPSLSPQTRVRHSPLAIFHRRRTGDWIDFALPGERFAIHPGVDEELRFIEKTAEFAIRDIPGASSVEVRMALVARLIAAGALETVAGPSRA